MDASAYLLTAVAVGIGVVALLFLGWLTRRLLDPHHRAWAEQIRESDDSG